jgi:hypothetical protein
MTTPDPTADARAWGLCASCTHHRVIASDRGSRFVQCARSRVDPRYPRYPVVPVRQCAGYERLVPEPTEPA